MISITAAARWNTAHPGALIGLLELSNLHNQLPSPQLNQRKRQVEARLRSDYAAFSRSDFLALPVMAAYQRYYRRFDNTYHVLLQVESLALKGKRLPDVSPLVDANFTAEVETLVLTAGHDADRLVAPLVIDVAQPGEQMTSMSGQLKPLRAGDMLMRDQAGPCCSILLGQDNRSPITPLTRRALYVAYAPPGVPSEAVAAQLQQIEHNLRLFAPDAILEQKRLLFAEE